MARTVWSLSLVLAAAPVASGAATFVTERLSVNAEAVTQGVRKGTTLSQNNVMGGVTETLIFAGDGDGRYDEDAFAFASTGRGIIRASADVSLGKNDPAQWTGQISSSGSATIINQLQFFSPTLNLSDEPIVVTAKIHVGGSMSTSNPLLFWQFRASWNFDIWTGLQLQQFFGQHENGNPKLGSGSGEFEISFPVTDGAIDFTMTGKVNASASARPVDPGLGSGIARSSYGQTFGWAGLVSVETESGTPIPDVVVTDQDGVSWNGSLIPAPSAFACLAIGAASLVRRRSR